MKKLELSDDQIKILTEVLAIDLKQLEIEVSRTDHMKFRDALIVRQHSLEEIVSSLRQLDGVEKFQAVR